MCHSAAPAFEPSLSITGTLPGVPRPYVGQPGRNCFCISKLNSNPPHARRTPLFALIENFLSCPDCPDPDYFACIRQNQFLRRRFRTGSSISLFHLVTYRDPEPALRPLSHCSRYAHILRRKLFRMSLENPQRPGVTPAFPAMR